MEVYAITIIASLAGACGGFLLKRGQEIDSAHKTRLDGDPGAVNAALAQVEQFSGEIVITFPGQAPRTVCRGQPPKRAWPWQLPSPSMAQSLAPMSHVVF